MCEKNYRGKNIIVVDKHKVLSKYLKSFLEKVGYKVFLIDRVENIGQFPDKERIDVIISDFDINESGEWNFVNDYRDNNKNISVIAMSTSEVTEIKEHINGFYPDGYLKKPFKVEELENLLSRLCLFN